MNETTLRRWLKTELDEVPLTFVEPSLGSSMGAPDVWVPTPAGFHPVELKIASFGRQGRLVPNHIRPVQISWHERMHRAGGTTFMLIGVWGATGWMAWMMRGCSRDRLKGWPTGFAQETLAQVAVDGKLDREAFWRSLAR